VQQEREDREGRCHYGIGGGVGGEDGGSVEKGGYEEERGRGGMRVAVL